MKRFLSFKKTLIITFLTSLVGVAVFSFASPTTYYVSTTGNDTTGNGTIGNPWATLYKACTTVTASGDTIHITAGTYTETQQCALSVGVSLEGDSQFTTTIKSTLTADWTEMVKLSSVSEGTNGNQHISNIKFDGQNLSTFWGITVMARSNVSIHDITMVDMKDRGVIIYGRSDGIDAAPTIYASGITFYNNTIHNCAAYDLPTGVYGRGALNIGGTQGMLVYNNVITQNERPEGFNGWPIKGWNGYNKDLKIYNNTLTKIPYTGGYPGTNGWDFAIEMFHDQHTEFYNNIVSGGSFDTNDQIKGSDPYSVWIHDNTFSLPTQVNSNNAGVILEFDTDTAIIENNTFNNMSQGVLFTPRPGNTITNVTIQKNLFSHVGMTTGDGSNGFFINVATGANDFNVDGLFIYNNTFLADPSNRPYWGIDLGGIQTGRTYTNVVIKNNIIAHTYSGGIVGLGTGMTNVTIANNDIFDISHGWNGDDPVWTGSTPTSYSYVNNIHVDPSFVSSTDYHLQLGSAAINTGVDVGLSFVGVAPDMGYAETGGAPLTYATWNPLDTSPHIALSNGNLTAIADGTTSAVRGTLGKSSGKWYWEYAVVGTFSTVGIGKSTMQLTDYPGTDANGYAIGLGDGNKYNNATGIAYTTASTGGDIIGIALDLDSGTLSYYRNGTSLGTAYTGLSGTFYPALGASGTNGTANFGATPFVYAPPAGFNAGLYSVGNVPPVVNAGTDQSIALPGTSSVTMAGSASDADGTIASHVWTKVAGPSTFTITSPTSYTTTITGLVTGVYTFRLTATDNQSAVVFDDVVEIVNATSATPTWNPTDKTSLFTLSGGNLYAISSPAGEGAMRATVSASSGKKYYEVTMGQSTYGALGIGTSAAPLSFSMGTSAVDYSLGFDGFRYYNGSWWAYGPSTYAPGDVIGVLADLTAGTLEFTVNGVSQGVAFTGIPLDAWYPMSSTYNSINDFTTNFGATPWVYSPPLGYVGWGSGNNAPTADAGVDKVVTTPDSSVSLFGSGFDPDGTVTSYGWSKISGATGTVIAPVASASVVVSGLLAGIYLFRLLIADNNSATDVDDVQVAVSAPGVPAVTAGLDQSLVLPVNTTTLSGNATASASAENLLVHSEVLSDASWQSSNVTITDNQALDAAGNTTLEKVDIGFIGSNSLFQDSAVVPGATYYFSFDAKKGTATDVKYAVYDTTHFSYIISPASYYSSLSSTASRVQFSFVVPAGCTNVRLFPIQTPAAGSSGSTYIGRMQFSTSATAPYATTTAAAVNPGSLAVASYAWSKVSGPSTYTIATPSSATTTFSNLVAGTYTMRLSATDSLGQVGASDMQVTVSAAANIPPTANAGVDQAITLPTSSVTVSAAASSDADGTIASYSWSVVSGPTTPSIVSPSSATTVITGLSTAGTYIFRATVVDNGTASSADDVNIVVSSAPVVTPPSSGGSAPLSLGISCPLGTTGIYPSCALIPVNTVHSSSGIAAYVKAIQLYVRSAPYVLALPIKTISNNESIIVLDAAEHTKWVHIKTLDGIEGYVHSAYIQYTPFVSIRAGDVATTNKQMLNVREGQSVSTTAVTTITPTSIVDVVSVSLKTIWAKIKTAEGVIGFVNKFFLRVVQ